MAAGLPQLAQAAGKCPSRTGARDGISEKQRFCLRCRTTAQHSERTKAANVVAGGHDEGVAMAGGGLLSEKWLVLGVLIGAMAGRCHCLLRDSLASTHLFLGILAGYHVPTPSAKAAMEYRHRSPDPGLSR